MEPMAQRYWGLNEFRLFLEAGGFTESAWSAARAARGARGPRRTMTFEAVRAG